MNNKTQYDLTIIFFNYFDIWENEQKGEKKEEKKKIFVSWIALYFIVML